MLASTLFVRVVPADKNRGYMLLAGYDANIVQRTALQYTTLCDITRSSLNAAIERMRVGNNAANVKDVTAPSIAKKLARMFGEVQTPTPPTTFSNLGIGQYLP
jgi:methionine aminopeptidase